MTKLTYEKLRKELRGIINVDTERNSVIIRFETGRVLYSYGSPAALILYKPDGTYEQYIVSSIWDYSRTTTKDVVTFLNYPDSKELRKAIKNGKVIEILLHE